MPKLIDAGHATPDTALEFRPPEAFTGATGIVLAVNTDLETLPQSWRSAPAIAIEFPVFSDGRGLSLAVLIRRAGFSGELRATGDIVLDMLQYLYRCGFDSFALRDDQDVTACKAALADGIAERHYPGSVIDPRPHWARSVR